MFMYEFASNLEACDEETDDEAEFICGFTSGFTSYLEDIAKSDDEWRRACALFLQMVFEVEEFVEAYREEDLILVEWGYIQFRPIFHETGQNKYTERMIIRLILSIPTKIGVSHFIERWRFA